MSGGHSGPNRLTRIRRGSPLASLAARRWANWPASAGGECGATTSGRDQAETVGIPPAVQRPVVRCPGVHNITWPNRPA